MTTDQLKPIRNLRGTWPRSLRAISGALLFICAIRWALVEPYVIPSGSMLPTLLVHDHIFVNKFAYGFRLPFASHYTVLYATPARGDVLVFRSIEDDSIFLVKRVVGLPGDEIQMKSDGLWINGVRTAISEIEQTALQTLLSDWLPAARDEALEQNTILNETLGNKIHPVFRDKTQNAGESPIVKVPPGNLFMSGDNRDHSADSRMWGTLPIDRVLGRASLIWLSCEEALAQTNQLCNPQTMRWHRLFKIVM